MRGDKKLWILAIEAYEGSDTAVEVFGAHEAGRLYAVVETGPTGAEIVDRGYRSREEAKRAWPEAR